MVLIRELGTIGGYLLSCRPSLGQLPPRKGPSDSSAPPCLDIPLSCLTSLSQRMGGLQMDAPSLSLTFRLRVYEKTIEYTLCLALISASAYDGGGNHPIISPALGGHPVPTSALRARTLVNPLDINVLILDAASLFGLRWSQRAIRPPQMGLPGLRFEKRHNLPELGNKTYILKPSRILYKRWLPSNNPVPPLCERFHSTGIDTRASTRASTCPATTRIALCAGVDTMTVTICAVMSPVQSIPANAMLAPNLSVSSIQLLIMNAFKFPPRLPRDNLKPTLRPLYAFGKNRDLSCLGLGPRSLSDLARVTFQLDLADHCTKMVGREKTHKLVVNTGRSDNQELSLVTSVYWWPFREFSIVVRR
ncbi:hypothetical protein SFRURICE_010659 [Spodoptera frugiperda]|nr:hypothetical protein SFRURICE_010659 [Spodoptera frugiperda]